MKALQVIDQAFRTTTEEQDDTILWLTQSMQGAGADLMLLLSGHGVQYAVINEPQPALEIGSWQQTQPAELKRDLSSLVEKNVPVYVVEEDLVERGLDHLTLTAGIKKIKRTALANLYEHADQVWHW
tara:strand:+ start:1318 stop:1698 length:381 start_codon:yes stop_codon:yes gene_type:complete